MNPDESILIMNKNDLNKMGQNARQSAEALASASAQQKTAALHNMAEKIRHALPLILKSNQLDIEAAENKDLSTAMIERLWLDEKRIQAIAESVDMIAELVDPIGQVISEWERPNGLNIQRVRTPLGVIGVIYESRPNVTADAGALCFKSGNAVILRGGSDSFYSSQALHKAMVEGLEECGFLKETIQLVTSKDHESVGQLLKGLNGTIDVIVPRGGKSLVARVQEEARVPVFAHLEGLCHIYIDASANLDMAREIIVNAKMRRTGICGAVETILIDKNALKKISPILETLHEMGCEVRASEDIQNLVSGATNALESDWSTEYLDAIVSVKSVEGIEGAIEHIQHYSSHHTEAIIAEDPHVVALFFQKLDSAILMHNASTQFADGGEFGFGAEIGIATGKMHARGPIGVEQLTTFQYLVRGNGQTRL
ncbi:glutamate-5-semialdehyde dehydrogenase [Bartonella tamiae]|uniref:Gamma-glutamyl phosphate reductase n=1 Tax=Bartonella tamiae Th239 TaxID=1094558 RepID=J1JZ81_9HYPH|nr:glutamate-5-semialdehyde dehydrogenase [Bartonella tamiae]EJF90397.1 glutamate-5-semialdehyde dehydrogenase [Bartonella tamiae Th239]EJF93659.1 glutamate-5-semialdehyde dehydrogenase [Bartonella tamiae Th307]